MYFYILCHLKCLLLLSRYAWCTFLLLEVPPPHTRPWQTLHLVQYASLFRSLEWSNTFASRRKIVSKEKLYTIKALSKSQIDLREGEVVLVFSTTPLPAVLFWGMTVCVSILMWKKNSDQGPMEAKGVSKSVAYLMDSFYYVSRICNIMAVISQGMKQCY